MTITDQMKSRYEFEETEYERGYHAGHAGYSELESELAQLKEWQKTHRYVRKNLH